MKTTLHQELDFFKAQSEYISSQLLTCVKCLTDLFTFTGNFGLSILTYFVLSLAYTSRVPSTTTTPPHNHTCSPDEYPCASGFCIDSSSECDQIDDCGDGSDEMNCGKLLMGW